LADGKARNQLPNRRLQLLLAMDVVAKAASPQFNQRMQVLMGLMVDQLTHSKNMFFLGSALGVCTSYDTIRDAVDKRAMQLLETMRSSGRHSRIKTPTCRSLGSAKEGFASLPWRE
jgi:hypothetical protein